MVHGKRSEKLHADDRQLAFEDFKIAVAEAREDKQTATGFAPLTSRLSLHIVPGYADMTDLLDRLGKHKAGQACLHINKLADVNLDVLEAIVRRVWTISRSGGRSRPPEAGRCPADGTGPASRWRRVSRCRRIGPSRV